MDSDGIEETAQHLTDLVRRTHPDAWAEVSCVVGAYPWRVTFYKVGTGHDHSQLIQGQSLPTALMAAQNWLREGAQVK